jgi:hypothetical protein
MASLKGLIIDLLTDILALMASLEKSSIFWTEHNKNEKHNTEKNANSSLHCTTNLRWQQDSL